MTSPPADTDTPRRHCWECLRRRLVCDSTRPVCSRCRTSGIVCPGYGEQQPLRWVKPGRVTARSRRRPKAAVLRVVDAKSSAENSPTTTADVDADADADANADADDGTIVEDEASLMRRPFSALMNRRGLNALMRYDMTCDNFLGLEASYICKSTRLNRPCHC